MSPRLHVLLGAGGVGKTTLAAGYALALARVPGRRVGLIGIDPSHRLKDALGVALHDVDAPVPSAGALRAAVLHPEEGVRRWATEACSDPAKLARLYANPFFAALADRLATATDIFAAARVAEWVEHDPALTDLVIDTAPGLNAIEFLTRPERVAAFLGGRLVEWLRWFAREEPTGSAAGFLRGGARRVLGSLSRIGGSRMLVDLADLFSLVDEMFARMLVRVQATQRWLRDASTQLVVVTSVRYDGAQMASSLVLALSSAGLTARAVVVNRALPVGFAEHVAPFESEAIANDATASPVIRYALAYAAIQARLVGAVHDLTSKTIVLPVARGLDGDARLEALTSIGELLRVGLD